MNKKIIAYLSISVFLCCEAGYAGNTQLRTPIGNYSRLEETLHSAETFQTLTERRFKKVMGPAYDDIRFFHQDDRTGRYVFQKELKTKKDAWITYYYENSTPVELDGTIDDLLKLYDETIKEDKDNTEIRYLVFKRLAKYRESAFRIMFTLKELRKTEKSKKVLDELQVAINMISGKTIDGGKRLKVAYVFYELSPFVGRGGVKDVAKELPRTFHNKRGNEASVFIPYWDKIVDEAIEASREKIRVEEVNGDSFELNGEKVVVYSITMLNRITGNFEPIDGVPIYLLKCDKYFSDIEKEDIYRQELDKNMPEGSHLVHPDNARTAIFFSKAVLKAMKALKLKPDVINTADWQTAHVDTLLKKSKNPETYSFFKGTKTMHTIHNIGPKGLVMASPYAPEGSESRKMWDFMDIADDAYQPPDQNGMEFYGRASLQKGGIVCADKVSTVGISYASELKTEPFGSGFDGIIRASGIVGVPNGISLREWNPATTLALSYNFENNPSEKDRGLGVLDTEEGKMANKAALADMINEIRSQKTGLAEFICDKATPVFCFLGRFDDQKGLNILLSVLVYDQEIKTLLDEGKIKMIFAGTGSLHYMREVKELEKKYPKSVAYLGWVNETGAKKLFAGADVNIMPSIFEPKGMVQMQAARFGAINLVNKVGGLKDDIIDFSEGSEGNGYVMDFSKGDAFLLLRDSIMRIIEDFNAEDKTKWAGQVRKALVDSDKFGWDLSCLKYELLFDYLTGNYADLLIRHAVDHFDLASKPYEQVFRELDINLSDIKFATDLTKLGETIGYAIAKNQNIGRPVDILLSGSPGSLKTTLASTLKEILGEFRISAEFVETDAMLYSQDRLFSKLNEKYRDKNVIIAESVIDFPGDAKNADLFIKLTGSLFVRQNRIEEGSGDYEYAKIRTEVEAFDFKGKKEDMVMNTDDIKLAHIESGSFKYFLKKGVINALESDDFILSNRSAGQSL